MGLVDEPPIRPVKLNLRPDPLALGSGNSEAVIHVIVH